MNEIKKALIAAFKDKTIEQIIEEIEAVEDTVIPLPLPKEAEKAEKAEKAAAKKKAKAARKAEARKKKANDRLFRKMNGFRL